MRKNKVICGLVLLAILQLAWGSRADARELTYRLKWLFNASVAGDIYAEDKGYFTKAGLQVKIKEGGPGKDAIKEIELGQTDFGVASADQVIRALEKGAEVVVLFQIFQINPLQWIYRDTLPQITALSQLKGKSIGITFGGNDETIMNTLLAKGGIPKKDVKIYSVRFDFTPFLTKKVQIWPVYRNSQGVILKNRLQAEGENVRFLNPADFGVNFVANSVITSKKMIETDPDIVDKFQTALLAAWRDAMAPANQESTLASIAARDKDNNAAITKLQLLATRELTGTQNFGSIDKDAWIQTEQIMLQEQQIKRPVNIQDWLHK
ncbi:ABC transporter substrate-binding protein [Desulfopila sp. IMCC35006]|uniref:ABC transporter substrate-binding protein n=1 Tax=Desulfopila sp. IMCC35006 TaxID=2569542 RepID=UPI0010AC596B|nr:ABC transporter substrate-binding protein [Desulfopila sp. IMCC35006]TKB25268.1 ABC transporter substrate-binding protein [Desulfopila sp. IMCC35006]